MEELEELVDLVHLEALVDLVHLRMVSHWVGSHRYVGLEAWSWLVLEGLVRLGWEV